MGDGRFNTFNYYASLMEEEIPRGLKIEEGTSRDETDQPVVQGKDRDCPLEEKTGSLLDGEVESMMIGREISPRGKREYRGPSVSGESTKRGEKSRVEEFLIKNSRRHAEEGEKDNGMSFEDGDDEYILPARRRVANRKRRVIKSVDGEESDLPIDIADSSSSSPEAAGKRRRSTPESVPEKKKKKNRRTPSLVQDRMMTRTNDPSVSNVGLDVLSASTLGTKINEWVDEIEKIRCKSKNLQGKLSGMMKS